MHHQQPMPFEQARTLLGQGEALRRAYRPAAERRPLRHALTVFTRLGARPWAARAMTELAATGVRAGNRNDTGTSAALDSLSPLELQVARAVGRGLNNLEVAAALFVSRKTVESTSHAFTARSAAGPAPNWPASCSRVTPPRLGLPRFDGRG